MQIRSAIALGTGSGREQTENAQFLQKCFIIQRDFKWFKENRIKTKVL